MAAVPPVPPVPPAPPPQQYLPPQYPQPGARKPSNAIWWVLGIIGACIVLVMIAGLVVVSALVHRVKVNTRDNKVEIETPVGSLKVNQDSAHATGLPVYPGAMPEKSQGADFEVSANGKSAGLAIEKYNSDDPRETVQAWYANRLGPDFKLQVSKPGDNDQIPGVPVDMKADDVAFVNDRGDGAKVVALTRHGEGTEITLVRVGKKEAQ
jgi:hypothetical protein